MSGARVARVRNELSGVSMPFFRQLELTNCDSKSHLQYSVAAIIVLLPRRLRSEPRRMITARSVDKVGEISTCRLSDQAAIRTGNRQSKPADLYTD